MRTTTENIKEYGIDYDKFFNYIQKLVKVDPENICEYIEPELMKDNKVCFILKTLYLLDYETINEVRKDNYTPEINTAMYLAYKKGNPFLHRYIKEKDIEFYFNFA